MGSGDHVGGSTEAFQSSEVFKGSCWTSNFSFDFFQRTSIGV